MRAYCKYTYTIICILPRYIYTHTNLHVYGNEVGIGLTPPWMFLCGASRMPRALGRMKRGISTASWPYMRGISSWNTREVPRRGLLLTAVMTVSLIEVMRAVSACAFVYECIYVFIYLFMYPCMVCMCRCLLARGYFECANVHAFGRACACQCMHVCVCVCVCVCICL
jgi:hypothetical protein